MKLFRLLAAIVLIPFTLSAQTWPGIKDSIFSKSLNEQRRLQVILPTEYAAGGTEKYETVYMLDGEWYMEQIPFIYRFAAGAGFAPKAIFVLIPNTYVNGVNLRDRDYSPTRINNDERLGHADNYHAFLKNELIPYIEKKYPVNGDKTLVGSSFSGLFSVYAFVKEPGLFNAYVASDPNLDWDNFYVSKLAEKMLPVNPGLNQELYIAGLDRTYRYNGIGRMDSVLKAVSPAGLHWKVQLYENETHYSVQHKAFYEGFRFIHLGYTTEQPEFHPMHGTVEPGGSVEGFFRNVNPAWHYTTDGSEPTHSSPVVSQGGVPLNGAVTIRVKSFAYRPSYDREMTVTLASGKAVEPLKTKEPLKAGLIFSHYTGTWTQIPDLKKLKPAATKPYTSGLRINDFAGDPNALYVIEGVLDVPEDAYYVFAIESADAGRIELNRQLLFDQPEPKHGAHSYGVSLKKGLYPLRAELLRKKGTADIEFVIFRTKAGNGRWWENPVQ